MATWVSHKFQIGDLVKEKISTEEEIFEIKARFHDIDRECLVYAVVAWEGIEEYNFDEEDLEAWKGEVEDEEV